jgi:hypothetical protein
VHGKGKTNVIVLETTQETYEKLLQADAGFWHAASERGGIEALPEGTSPFECIMMLAVGACDVALMGLVERMGACEHGQPMMLLGDASFYLEVNVWPEYGTRCEICVGAMLAALDTSSWGHA